MCRIAMIWACGRNGFGGAEDTEYLLPGTEEKVLATAAAVAGNHCLNETAADAEADAAGEA